MITATKQHVAANYLTSGKWSSKQLAEGIMESMGAFNKAHKHAEMLSGRKRTEIDSRMEKDLDYVHRKYEEQIKEHWTKPTPTEAEIASELAGKEFEAYEQQMLEELAMQTSEILRIIKRKEKK